MSAPKDLDRLLRSFLTDGPLELPDPSYDQVRDRTETTRQRAVIGSWRTPDVNRLLKIGLAAAAVVVIAVIGYQLSGGSVGGPGATETPESSIAEATPSAAPSSTPGALLPEGSHRLWDAQGDKGQITVTIPAPGWYGEPDQGFIVKNNNADAPDGAGLIVFAETNQLFAGFGDLYVYGDPCHWATTTPDTPVTTVDEAVAALSSQALRDTSAPVDVTVAGHAGKSITLHVPDDAVFSECDQGEFRSWIEGPEGTRYHQDPGQIDKLWILDVGGALDLVIIDAGYYAGTPQNVLEEIDAVVESATFN
jgi:hypothetical protein